MRLVYFFFLLVSTQIFADEQLPKVYFSAKIGKEEYRKENSVLSEVFFHKDLFRVFMPQELFIPHLDFAEIERCSYEADKAAIDWCDFLFLAAPYGRDCSWEVGYAAGKEKYIVAYLNDESFKNDTMVMCSAHLIVTDLKHVFDQLTRDPRTARKSVLIDRNSKDLHDLVMPRLRLHKGS